MIDAISAGGRVCDVHCHHHVQIFAPYVINQLDDDRSYDDSVISRYREIGWDGAWSVTGNLSDSALNTYIDKLIEQSKPERCVQCRAS